MRTKLPIAKLMGLVLPAVLAMSAMPAGAQAPAEDEVPKDARLEGFTRDATPGAAAVGSLAITPPSGTAGTWIMCVILGGLCVGVMCKNGKRTHLD